MVPPSGQAAEHTLNPLHSQPPVLLSAVMAYKTTGDNSSYLRASTMQRGGQKILESLHFTLLTTFITIQICSSRGRLLAVITVSSRIKYTVLYTSYHKVLSTYGPVVL